MMLSEKGKAFLQLHISVLLAGFTGLFGRLVSLDAVMSEKVCKILLVLSPMLGKPKHRGNL